MLVRLLHEQITSHWEAIKLTLKTSIPLLANEETAGDILVALLAGKMHCWLSYRKSEDFVIEAFAITQIVEDRRTREKNLLIYAIHSAEGDTTRSSWLKGLGTLRTFAKESGCQCVIGYTKLNSVVEFAKRVGGEVEHLVKIPVEVEI